MRRKEERAWERAAWMVHYLLAAWIEKPPSVHQLLGRTRKRE
jgi:hypothetical protein